MIKLAANWQYLLVSQIARGKYFMRPDLAIALTGQATDLILAKNGTTAEKRRIELTRVSLLDNGLFQRKSFYLDEDDEDEDMETTSSIYDDAPSGSVAIIPLKGSMMKYGTWCDYGTNDLAAMVMDAVNHKNIGAIVLDIDSGGGAVDAVAPMVHAIDAAKSAGKPIVASVDMACSAAYWVASECNAIVADNSISSEVGSIGVMMSFMDATKYYEEKGITLHSIYSNHSSGKNESFRLALEGKYDMIKEEDLDPLAVAFQNTVRRNRAGKLDESTPGMLSGKTFFGEAALKTGLIDHLGDNRTAINLALGMSHAKQL
tara:strand:+ start:8143 stop:9093 length:951 start_codon:yes stop_codon:yes gene_type:complete